MGMKINELYTINGVTKPFLDWCAEFKHSPLLIRARMSGGLNLKEALELRDNKRDLIICIDGREGTLQFWCQKYCISCKTVTQRISKGWRLDEAVKEPIMKQYSGHAQVFTVNGKEMTIAQLSAVYGINQSTIKSRLRKGETILQALNLSEVPNRQSSHLKVEDGSFYQSYTIGDETKTLNKWCEEFHIQYPTVRDRLKRGMDLLSALTVPGQTSPIHYFFEGKNRTLSEISIICGVNLSTLKSRLSRGMTIQEAIIPPSRTTYAIEGESYTLREIAEKYGINMNTLKGRLRRGLTIHEALEFECETTKKLYFIDGDYKTLRQISELYGVSTPALRGRLHSGMSIQEAIAATSRPAPRTYYVDGKYKTLRQISEEYNVKYATLRSRLWAGKSIHEAIKGHE